MPRSLLRLLAACALLIAAGAWCLSGFLESTAAPERSLAGPVLDGAAPLGDSARIGGSIDAQVDLADDASRRRV